MPHEAPQDAREDIDIPPRVAGLLKVALGLGASAIALGGSALALCLAHHA